jgi:hypothetical protein
MDSFMYMILQSSRGKVIVNSFSMSNKIIIAMGTCKILIIKMRDFVKVFLLILTLFRLLKQTHSIQNNSSLLGKMVA